jgi:uncharacterized protein (DUF2141 family)
MMPQVAWLLLLACLGLSSLGCDRTNPETVKPQSSAPVVRSDSNALADSHHDAIGADGSQEKLYIEIVTEGYEMGEGKLRVALYDGPKSFNKVDLAKWKDLFEADGKPILIELERGLFPNNELAVAVYQDSNSNNQLDKNAFGIPQESYGFSSNPKRGFGPPKYSEVAVPIPAEKLSLTITLK